MGKLLLIIVAVVVIYLLLAGAARGRRASRNTERAGAVENMVNCAHCGLNLPQSEAIESGGRFFCGEEHRRLGAR